MLKNVLIAGPKFYGYLDNLADSFRLNGYNVHLYPFDLKDYRRNIPDELKMEQFNSDIRKCVLSNNLDMAVIVKGDTIWSDTVRILRSNVKRMILYLWDAINRSVSDLSVVKYFDKVLLFEKSDESIMQDMGIPFAFYGTPASTHDYYPADSPGESVDISFVGSITTDRLSSMKAIIKAFPDRNIEIYGGHSRLISRRWLWINLSIRNCRRYFMNRGLIPSEINTLYNSSKICLNVQRSQSLLGCNYRTFEILAAKAFQISSANPYLESEFKDGGLVTYRDDSDLIDKIGYYLANTDERRRHAEIGYRYVQQHSYENKFYLFEQ